MVDKNRCEQLFQKYGFSDVRWIDPQDIVIAQWVRMKCRFGCKEYGQNACCPPNTPTVDECARFFREYKTAAIFHFMKKVPKSEDRHAWTHGINMKLLKMEKEVFLSGYEKAFLLFIDSCSICNKCPGKREDCKEPRLARPTPEALAMDVYSTVRKAGYSIAVLPDHQQTMNRYAFLLIE